MPKDSKLDRCHTHVQESLIKKGTPPKEADGKAWAICKKNIPEDNGDKEIKEFEATIDKLHKK